MCLHCQQIRVHYSTVVQLYEHKQKTKEEMCSTQIVQKNLIVQTKVPHQLCKIFIIQYSAKVFDTICFYMHFIPVSLYKLYASCVSVSL